MNFDQYLFIANNGVLNSGLLLIVITLQIVSLFKSR